MVLTRRQRQVVDLVVAFTRDNGYCPSFVEIAEGLGLSSIATVHKHVESLEKKGWLRRGPNQSRSLEPGPRYIQEQRQLKAQVGNPVPSDRLDMSRATSSGAEFTLPMAGRIAAGQPIEAPEQPETISLSDIAGSKDVYVLQVKGESMIEDHIMDGDYVMVEKTREVRDGEIAVALVGGTENTLKRLYHERDGRIRLQPANSAMQPIMVAAADVVVQGRVVGVLRRY
ncbi:MAG: transcriptional repressor LexA [Acidobacteria bacterium]|nr:transcriptional repressor LexA [Acidobacteriota bacterium]